MTESLPPPPSPTYERTVIDLTSGPQAQPTAVAGPAPASTRVRVSIARDTNPFTAMSDAQRRRLLVRVLCELVAYGEPIEPSAPVEPAVVPVVDVPAAVDVPVTEPVMAMTPF